MTPHIKHTFGILTASAVRFESLGHKLSHCQWYNFKKAYTHLVNPFSVAMHIRFIQQHSNTMNSLQRVATHCTLAQLNALQDIHARN